MNKKLALITLIFFIGSVSATVTSVDEINFDSNSQYFDGEVIRIEYISDFSTEKINIDLSSSELSQATGREVKDSVQFDVTSQNTKVEYGTRDVGLKTASLIEGIKHTEPGLDAAFDWAEQNCWDNDGDASTKPWYIKQRFGWDWDGTKYDIYCARTNGNFGKPAAMDTGDKIWSTTWEYSINGDVKGSKTITNGDGKNTIRFGNAVITGIGAHTSGAGKPDNSNVYALHNNQFDGNWRIISQSRYDAWTNRIESHEYVDLLERWGKGELENGESQFESNFNGDLREAVEPAQGFDIYGGSWTDGSFNAGTYEVDVADTMLFPAFAVNFKAGEDCGEECVTIEKSVGQAQIVDSSGATVGEYSTKEISVTFENTADVEGAFEGYASCSDSQFDVEGVTKRATVDTGNRHTFSFDLSFSSGSDQEQVSSSCTMNIQNAEAKTVSTSVDVTGKQADACKEGNELVKVQDGKEVIMVCADGFNLERQEGDAVCGQGEEPRLVSTAGGLNDYECKDTGSSGGGNEGGENCVVFSTGTDNQLTPSYELKNPFCGKNILGQVGEALHWFFALLIGTILGYTTYKLGRWFDGELQIRGGFKPWKTRSVSRVKRGRFLVGLLAGLIGFAAGVWIGLSIPVWVEILFFILMIIVAWIADKYTDFISLF